MIEWWCGTPGYRGAATALKSLRNAQVILWKGHCSVHKRFTVAQIEKARREYPGINVIVHPECELPVVQAADLPGSTEFILARIAAAEPGSQMGGGYRDPAWFTGLRRRIRTSSSSAWTP